MRTVECDALLVRAQGGEPAAWTSLALLMHREVEITAALYAADQAMVAAVCADCWPTAQQWLSDQRYPQRAKTGFMLGTPNESKVVLQLLRDQALAALRQRLIAYDRAAIANKDAVSHLIAQSGLEALPRSGAEVPNVLPLINERLKRSSPSIQGLMIKRQRERMSVTQMAGIAGRSAGQVAHAICQARNTTDWHPGGALSVAAGDSDFPLMIEEFIDGTLAAELYTGLVQILLGDLDSTACFVRQIRLDLVLTACLHLDVADASHLLTARAATPPQASARRPPISERIVQAEEPRPEARPITAATRNPKLKKSAGTANQHLGLLFAAGGAVVVVIAAVVVMSRSGKPSPPPVTDHAAGVEQPRAQDQPTDKPAAKPLAVDTSIRIEAGQPTVKRDSARLRLKPGDTLRGDDSFDSDASAGPVVLTVSGGRKLTVGVNSAITGVQFDTSGAAEGADNVLLSRGYLQIDAPAGSRGVTLRSGSATVVGNAAGSGASFSLTTLGSGQRVEVSRGSVRLQRGSTPLGTLFTGQMAALNDNGEVQVMSAGTFVLGINLGGSGVTIDDHRWKAQRHAEADGLTISGGNPMTGPLSAEVVAALRPLLDSGVGGNAVKLSQTLPDGTYDVVCWVAGRPGSTMSTLTIQGQGEAATASDSAALDKSGWRRLAPRRCVVSGGHLTLNFSGAAEQRLAGVMIQTGGTDVGGKPIVRLPPTVFLDHPADGLSVPVPATLACKAKAYVPDGAIRSIEFLVDGAKVGETTEPPHVFSWTSQTPGVHQLAARVVTASGLTANVPSVGITVQPAEKIIAPTAQPILPGALFLVDDLERDAAGWEYVGGWEFPGSKGTAGRDAGAAHGGHHAYRLDYDFSGGGTYVGVWKKLEDLAVPNISEIRFWVKSSGGLGGLGVRLSDGSGQLHQSSVPLQTNTEWQEVVVKISQATGGEHWAGANDGKWHPSLKGLGLNVGKDNSAKSGTLWLDDLRVVIAAP